MAQRITSANGKTTAVNQEIVSVMKTFTSINGKSDLFRPTTLYLECDINTSIFVNGENAVFLKKSDSGYAINLGNYDIIPKTLVIGNSGVTWRATFLF